MALDQNQIIAISFCNDQLGEPLSMPEFFLDGNYGSARILKEFGVGDPFNYSRWPSCLFRKREPVLISTNVLEATKLMRLELHAQPANVSRE